MPASSPSARHARSGIRVPEDAGLQSLLKAGTSAIAIFGKSWDYQVLEILRTTLDENLRMISDTVRYLKQHGKEVVFDAEHFFDGYKDNADYALKSLAAAAEAGADSLCLCDTNGGSFPDEIFEITRMSAHSFPMSPSASIAITTAKWRWPIPSARCRPARRRCRARSTAWASAAATPISARSFPTCS